MSQEALRSVAGSVLGQRSVLIIFGMGAVLLGAAGWSLARRRAWAPVPAVLAGISLALAFAVTQGRQPFQFAEPSFSGCVLTSAGSGVSETVLNVIMLVPLGVTAGLATGRIVLPALCCVSASVFFEVLQGLFDTGFCVGQDAVSNSIGGVCAAALGGWLGARRHHAADEAVA